MTKILRLIGNEWKKEFFKVSTWVTLLLLVAVTVFTALSGLFSTFDSWIYAGSSFEEYCENEIAWNEEMLLTGKDDEESLNYYRVQIEAHRMMLDAEMDFGDWRYVQGLATTAAEAKYGGDSATYETLMTVIRENDPAKYFAWQKGTYETRYSNDPERCRIYTSLMDYCAGEGVIPYAEADWRYGQVMTLMEKRDMILVQERLQASGGAWSESTLSDARNDAAVAAYRLERGVQVNPADSFASPDWGAFDYGISAGAKTSLYWDAMNTSTGLLSFAGVLAIIVAGGIVANEFSAGTIKFLLMSPIRRWKILLAKYITVLLYGMGLCAVVWLLSAVSALPLGAGDVLLPAVFAENGEVYTVSPYLLMLGDYGLAFLQTVVMCTMAFALSALTRKASAAIALTVFLYLSGSMIASMLYLFGFDWGRYLLFSNLDLAAIAEGTTLIYPHQSLGTAIVIIVLHMAVFLLTAHDAFVRREV